MQFAAVDGVPDLDTSPRAAVQVEGAELAVALDTASGERLDLRFRPLQAVRITTEDCFMVPPGLNLHLRPRRVVEITESPWLQELEAALQLHDGSATFMQRSHHFVLLAGDRFIEVAAWTIAWRGGISQGTYPADDPA